jgi:hypothetical protein
MILVAFFLPSDLVSDSRKNATSIIQISKDNAYQVALGTELRIDAPEEPIREMQADGITPLRSDAAYGQIKLYCLSPILIISLKVSPEYREI